jgi:5'-nucleotidase
VDSRPAVCYPSVVTLPTLLLTNDDGIDAEGLSALREAAATLGRAVVVSTEECHSGAGHRVTTHAPIELARRDVGCYVIDGTPADCVRVGLDRVVPEAAWILSGINHGGNLGADVYMSGTVAAVREGVLHGRPGIAVSHYHRKGVDPLDWARAARWLTPILGDLMSRPQEPHSFWNVNLPHLAADAPDPEIVMCPVDPSPLPVSYRTEGDRLHYNGNYHERVRVAGGDVDWCFRGRITISRVRLL